MLISNDQSSKKLFDKVLYLKKHECPHFFHTLKKHTFNHYVENKFRKKTFLHLEIFQRYESFSDDIHLLVLVQSDTMCDKGIK